MASGKVANLGTKLFFIGKAQEAYVALDPVQSTDYKAVKDVVLWAYEVVPEGHRQMFRSLRRKHVETYLDLVKRLFSRGG